MSGPNRAGLVDQVQQVRGSLMGLLRAHIGLLRAEISDILDQLKIIAGLAGAALAVALMVGCMLYVGGFLFLGEWLFGSIGWGFAHGVLFGIGLIVILVLAIVGARGGSLVGSFLVAALIAVGLALLCGLNIGYDTADYFSRQLASPFGNVGLIAALAGAVVLGILLMLLLWRVAGGGGALFGLVLGILLGLMLGWLIGGAPWTWPPAVGFGITIGFLLWPMLAVAMAWRGLDVGERFARLYPRQSIEAANETKAWLEEQWQTRRPKRGDR